MHLKLNTTSPQKKKKKKKNKKPTIRLFFKILDYEISFQVFKFFICFNSLLN